MELMILDSNLKSTGIIDVFESLIWTDRYFECGDFELLAPPSIQNLSSLTQAVYAQIEESDHFMVIEDIHIKTDPVEGNKLVVKGRSFESAIERRIIDRPIIFETEPIQYAIFTLLNEHAINPADPLRKINKLEFEFNTTDPNVNSIKISNQYWGQDLYKSIVDLCFSNNIGFKIILTDDERFVFKLYSGLDKGYTQTDNPYVVFSPNFENLKNSEYIKSTRLLRTWALIAGEKGVGNAQAYLEIDPSQGRTSDLSRREMFIDAQGVTRVDQYGFPISDEEYYAHLYQKGLEELSKNIVVQTFASEVDPSSQFIFGRDFFLGDILQVSNEYGYEGKSRVIEVVRCQDPSGIKIYPIFSIVEESKTVEESINLAKYLTVSCPKDISESINLGKKLGLFNGMHETIDFIIFSDMFANGRFD